MIVHRNIVITNVNIYYLPINNRNDLVLVEDSQINT